MTEAEELRMFQIERERIKLENWIVGKKRHCQHCNLTFATRKDKQIHYGDNHISVD